MTSDLRELLDEELFATESQFLSPRVYIEWRSTFSYWRELNADLASIVDRTFDVDRLGRSPHGRSEIIEIVEVHRALVGNPAIILFVGELLSSDEPNFVRYVYPGYLGESDQALYSEMGTGLLGLIVVLGRYLTGASTDAKQLIRSFYGTLLSALVGETSSLPYLERVAKSLTVYRRFMAGDIRDSADEEQFEHFMKRLADSVSQVWFEA